MKILNVFLFALMHVSSGAFGQRNNPAKATIVVLSDSSAGETMHLLRFHAPGLDYDRVDSATVPKDGIIKFSVVPNVSKEYEIALGRDVIEWGIFLAPGDSLALSFHGHGYAHIDYDLIGACAAYQNSSQTWTRDSNLYTFIDKKDWHEFKNYIAQFRQRILDTSKAVQARYPEHTGLANWLQSQAEYRYYDGLIRYMEDRYWHDSTDKPIVNDPSRFSFLDSVPWTSQPFGQSSEAGYAAGDWLSLSVMRWTRAGVDTAGVIHQRKAFDLSLALPMPARDAAVLSSLFWLYYMKAPEAVKLGEKELKEYEPTASDSGYVKKFEAKLAMLRTKLPGKQAPEFSLPDTTGKLRTLAGFRGKIIYLDFWGNWCGPCLGELADLKKLQEKFSQDTSVAFLSIALEASHYKEENLDAWKKCIKDSSLHGTHLYADDQFQNEYVLLYGIQAVPTFMIIGRDGTFIDAAAPRPSSGKAEDAIRSALARDNN